MADKIAYSGFVNINGNFKLGKKKCDLAYVVAKESNDELAIDADIGGIAKLSLFKGNRNIREENEKYSSLVKGLLEYKIIIKIGSSSILLGEK